MNKQIEGIVTDKKLYTGDSSNAPAGDIYIEGDKFACWKKELFDKFNIGEQVSIEYTEKQNEYNGKTYVNKSISNVLTNTDVVSNETSGVSFKSEPFTIDNNVYKIVGKLELQ